MRPIVVFLCSAVRWAAFSLPLSAAAQRTEATTETGPGWHKRAGTLQGLNATAAEKAYALARIDEIERILLKVPEFAHPDFPLYSGIQGFYASAPKANTILNYRYVVWVPPKSRSCTILTIDVNQTQNESGDRDATGRSVTREEWFGKQRPDVTLVWRKLLPPPDPSFELVFFAPDGDPPWTPLTREEFRRFEIFEAEGANGEKRAAYRARLEKTQYDRWMEEAPQRKKERDEMAAGFRAVKTTAETNSFIKEMENTEREVTARLKATDAEERQQNQATLNAPWIGDKLRASIAAMSPAERKLPALVYLSDNRDIVSQFASPDSEEVTRYVYTNADFWRARKIRTEVRSIKIEFAGRCTKEPPPPPAHRALWALHEKLDWAALKALVNAKP